MTPLYRESGAAQPRDVPDGVAFVLRAHGGTVVRWWREGARTYLEADSERGPLFVRYSAAARDQPVLAHEVAVRRALAGQVAFRVPDVVAWGSGWLVEHRVVGRIGWGPARAGATAAAAVALVSAPLPIMDAPPGRAGVLRRAWRLGRVARSALPLGDYMRAKSLLASSPLPTVTGHGDFHVGNTLFAGGEVWVIDWELAGPQPQGWDLAQLWASLPDAADRAVVAAVALDWVGGRHRRHFAQLQYAALVRAVAAKVAPDRRFDREEGEARALLRLLPEVRDEAGISAGLARGR